MATRRHRLPEILAKNPENLPKSVLPPAQECQMAQLGALPEPVEPKCSHKLAGNIPSDTTGEPRHPKCIPNWCQICHQAHKETIIQASKHPSLGSQRSAAEAVAFSINTSIYIYIYIYVCILIHHQLQIEICCIYIYIYI